MSFNRPGTKVQQAQLQYRTKGQLRCDYLLLKYIHILIVRFGMQDVICDSITCRSYPCEKTRVCEGCNSEMFQEVP